MLCPSTVNPSKNLLLLSLLVGLAAPGLAVAQDDDTPEAERSVSAAVGEVDDEVEASSHDEGVHGAIFQRLVALLNPMGAEHTLAIGAAAPIGDQSELLFDGAHVGAGVINYFSPIYSIQGGYLRISPLSFFVLHTEITQTAMWPIGMSGAGYFGLGGDDALDGYDSNTVSQALPADGAESATGWSFELRATLQGELTIAGPVGVMIANEVSLRHDTLGDAPYYYSMKHDLIMAQQDWVVLNSAVVNAEIRVASDLLLSIGAFSDLRVVPRSGYVHHQAGPMVSFAFEDVSPEVQDITIWVRGGYYTHHFLRQDCVTILGGAAVHYDTGAL